MNFDAHSTDSSGEQRALELKVRKLFERTAGTPGLLIDRAAHVRYLHSGLGTLPRAFVSLEAARPWILYWITHSLALLKASLPTGMGVADIAAFLVSCQAPGGGFGGSPGQPAHLAPTYAAVAAAVTAGGEALRAVDRPAVLSFLRRCAVPPEAGGGFTVCTGGETDVRGCYTAVATAHMLGLDARGLAEEAGMVEYIRRCQTYEGGLGGEPGNEAHGGYTYCGLAALALVGQAHRLDLRSLLRFAVRCQGSIEGGFMGRTNKLVDGCYSFWQGGLFPVLQSLAPLLDSQRGVPRSPGHERPSESPSTSPRALSGLGTAETTESSLGTLTVPSLPGGPRLGLSQQAESATTRAQAAVEAAVRRLEAARSRARPHEDPPSEAEQTAAEALELACQAERFALETEDLLQDCAVSRCPEGGPPKEGLVVGEGATECEVSAGRPLYNAAALRTWLLLCCQAPGGGLRDKPGKPPDYYHTCYCLSGLSSAQHFGGVAAAHPEGALAKADPLCNVVQDRLEAGLAALTLLGDAEM